MQGGCIAACARFFCRETAFTCVSIEVLPFLPLLIAACVTCTYMLTHLHVVHGLSCPLARLSSRLTEVRWGALFDLLRHSLHLMTLGGKFAGLRV